MTFDRTFNDRDILERYTDQPSQLPHDLRARILAGGIDSKLIAYALSDLDERLAFRSTWLVLTTLELVPGRREPGGSFELRSVPRRSIAKIDLATGLFAPCWRLRGRTKAVVSWVKHGRADLEGWLLSTDGKETLM